MANNSYQPSRREFLRTAGLIVPASVALEPQRESAPAKYDVKFEVEDSNFSNLFGKLLRVNMDARPPYGPFSGTLEEINAEYERLKAVGLIPDTSSLDGRLGKVIVYAHQNPDMLNQHFYRQNVIREEGFIKVSYRQENPIEANGNTWVQFDLVGVPKGRDGVEIVSVEYMVKDYKTNVSRWGYNNREIWTGNSKATQGGVQITLRALNEQDMVLIPRLDLDGKRKEILAALKNQNIRVE